MRQIAKPGCVLAALAGMLAGCTATANPDAKISVGFYEVSGHSTQTIDRQLALHGPYIPGKGRVLAAADIALVPRVVLREQSGRCTVQDARFQVQAKITLPKWRQRPQVTGELAEMWDNFAAYAAVHELVHIRIAEEHANRLGRHIRQLPAESDCRTLGRKIDTIVKQMEREHSLAQDQFDAEESRKFERSAHGTV